MKDFFKNPPLCSFRVLFKRIRKIIFPCCRKQRFSLTYLLRPTKTSQHHDLRAKKRKHMLIEAPANNGMIKERMLSEINEIKPKRFHLEVSEYPENQLIVCGEGLNKLILRVGTTKLQAQNKPKEEPDSEQLTNTEIKKEDIKSYIKKYYKERYLLFSLYDHGVQLDEEAWFSTTPEAISEYVARRVGGGVVLDGFCGAGGNTIQFAKYCQSVVANDIDPNKISFAKHNARIYDVQGNIIFLTNDYLALELPMKVDLVFLSPPWGGVGYSTDSQYSLKKWVTPDIMKIMEKTWQFSEKVVLCLPKNINVLELVDILIRSAENSGKKIDRASIEIEKVYLNRQLKLNLIYFGNASKISKSIEYNKIYEKVLPVNTEKAHKGFNFKQKEFLKKLIERVGMMKIYCLAEEVSQRKGSELSNLDLLCRWIVERGILSGNELQALQENF